MDTISTIVGPSITLLCPLVGSSLLLPRIGSDFRNRTSSLTMYHQNVEVYNLSPSYILVILFRGKVSFSKSNRLFNNVWPSSWLFTMFGHQVGVSRCLNGFYSF